MASDPKKTSEVILAQLAEVLKNQEALSKNVEDMKKILNTNIASNNASEDAKNQTIIEMQGDLKILVNTVAKIVEGKHSSKREDPIEDEPKPTAKRPIKKNEEKEKPSESIETWFKNEYKKDQTEFEDLLGSMISDIKNSPEYKKKRSEKTKIEFISARIVAEVLSKKEGPEYEKINEMYSKTL